MKGATPTATTSRPVAAFDFDGTLLDGDCLLILHSMVRSPLGRLGWSATLPALLLWKVGLRSTAWFKRLFLRVLLTPAMQVRSRLQQQSLLQHTLANACGSGYVRVRPAWIGIANMATDWVIVSASPRCLLQPIAERLKVDLIATETSDLCNASSIELRSPNCKGTEKIKRLSQWLEAPLHSVELHAYGDSIGDRELLQSAAVPHWRSFQSAARPYPAKRELSGWLTPLAAVLLLSVLGGLFR